MALEDAMLRTAFGPRTLPSQLPVTQQRSTATAAAALGPRTATQSMQCGQIAIAIKSCRVRGRGKVVTAAAVAREATQEVALESELGVSYEQLRDKLAAGEWEAADAETRRLLCVLAGEAATKRKWVYFSEVQFIPEADLRTVDGLWRAYSNNKFGYSVQRRVWKNVNESWTAFFTKVGWTRRMVDSRNDAYKKFPLEFMWDVADPTPFGHLPLTNALRGTRLLENLLNHPAFDFADDEEKLLLPDTESLLQPPPQQQQQQEQQTPQQSQRKAAIPDDMTVDYGF